MNTAAWLIILLLNIKIVCGLSAPRAIPLFPDESDENPDDSAYDEMNVLQPNDPLPNGHRSRQKPIFRIDSMAIPCQYNATMSFCEDVPNEVYPTKYVESVLANAGAQTYETYFNKTMPDESLKVRLLSAADDEDVPIELCNSVNRLIFPQLAKNVENKWHFIINQPNYQQPIYAEFCQPTRSKCHNAFPNHVASCIQQYKILPLLSVREDGEIISEYYKMPIFCKCQLKRKKNPKQRKY